MKKLMLVISLLIKNATLFSGINAGSGNLLMAVRTVAFFGYLEQLKNVKTVIHKNLPPTWVNSFLTKNKL
jgi:hypothetical protein